MHITRQYQAVLTTLAAIISLALTGCGGSQILSHQVPAGTFAESDAVSWSGITPIRASKSYYISLANDPQALFIRIAITQDLDQRVAARHGITVWVDPGGGTSREFGLHYPIGGERRPESEGEGGFDSQDPGGSPSERHVGGLEMEIFGHDGTNKERLLITQGEGLRVGLKRDSKELVFTARIPFARFPELVQALKAAGEHHLGIGIEMAAMGPRPAGRGEGDMGPESGEPGGEYPGGEAIDRPGDRGGMSPDSDGGRRRGGMRRGPGQDAARTPSTSDWYKVVLQ